MVMEARALEARPIGRHEVRITRVYTVEAGEFATKHDPTPNWTENQAPAVGFELRIEAEAGEHIVETVNPAYVLDARAECLSNPDATSQDMGFNPDNLHVTLGPIAFQADGWEYDSSQAKYTKTWSLPFPGAALNAGPGILCQVNEIYQFFVTLIDNNAGAKTVACFAASEPFLLL